MDQVLILKSNSGLKKKQIQRSFEISDSKPYMYFYTSVDPFPFEIPKWVVRSSTLSEIEIGFYSKWN